MLVIVNLNLSSQLNTPIMFSGGQKTFKVSKFFAITTVKNKVKTYNNLKNLKLKILASKCQVE